MTDQIFPFEVLQVRDDIGGCTVFYKIGKRVLENNVQSTMTMQSAMFVEDGKDINETLMKALTEQGWIV